MVQFLQSNWVTILTLLALVLIVFLAVRKLVRDKKNGVGACGCKCAECPMHGQCAEHRQTPTGSAE